MVVLRSACGLFVDVHNFIGEVELAGMSLLTRLFVVEKQQWTLIKAVEYERREIKKLCIKRITTAG